MWVPQVKMKHIFEGGEGRRTKGGWLEVECLWSCGFDWSPGVWVDDVGMRIV